MSYFCATLIYTLEECKARKTAPWGTKLAFQFCRTEERGMFASLSAHHFRTLFITAAKCVFIQTQSLRHLNLIVLLLPEAKKKYVKLTFPTRYEPSLVTIDMRHSGADPNVPEVLNVHVNENKKIYFFLGFFFKQ